MNKTELLATMKADTIPGGWSGLWFVTKSSIQEDKEMLRHGKKVMLPIGQYTFLWRVTDATLHLEPPGEVVMEDTPFELSTHLGFVFRAFGRVLVTGLGLGCVIRGLQANENVERITCIENSADVLKLVAPYMASQKLEIIEADALSWTSETKQKFDCAWHDIWTDKCAGEPHLDIYHMQIFINCKSKVKYQGAWGFNRDAKRLMLKKHFPWMG